MGMLDRDVVRLRALAHPVRLGMMRQLAERPETCACDFTEVFAVSQPTISQHLKVLRDAGLVRTRRRGTQICYSIDDDEMRALRDVISVLGHSAAGALLATAAGPPAGH
jgi:ArsR family transcriptional regulator, arsenate/arsenite/antimonite-responsive transcriptional repressor